MVISCLPHLGNPLSSGRLAQLLRKRAKAMLEGAKWRYERGEYDLACFEAEQAAQLGLKALLHELLGRAPRTHSLTELLGVLRNLLVEAELDELVERVSNFVMEFRKDLWALEEAYYRGRYGFVEYDAEEAKRCIRIAEKLLKLLEEVRDEIRKGSPSDLP